MGNLILLNDVLSERDEEQLIVGDSDIAASEEGLRQSITVADNIQSKIGRISVIITSDAMRISKMVHQIRARSPEGRLASIRLKVSKALRERSFGVLTATRYSFDSDLFRHTRICAEGGESISQCRERMIKILNEVCGQNNNVLAVSHPFACQIASNSILNKSHTALTSFWMKKGAMMRLKFKNGKYGRVWTPSLAYNAVLDQEYTIDEVYSDMITTF